MPRDVPQCRRGSPTSDQDLIRAGEVQFIVVFQTFRRLESRRWSCFIFAEPGNDRLIRTLATANGQ
jgi:hypothetical protein